MTKPIGTEANVGLVKEFLDAMANGRTVDLAGMMTDDFKWTVMTAGGGTSDRAVFLAIISSMVDILDGPLLMMTNGWTVQDDRVAVEAESNAKTRDGRIYNNRYHFLFQIRAGKIASGREYMDSLHAELLFGLRSGEPT